MGRVAIRDVKASKSFVDKVNKIRRELKKEGIKVNNAQVTQCINYYTKTNTIKRRLRKKHGSN